MKTTQCRPELLVDYADAELPPEQARLIEEHLSTCADCRRTLAGLRKSVWLARETWQENEATLEHFQPHASARFLSLRRAPAVAIAAAVALAFIASITWFVNLRDSTPGSPVVDRAGNDGRSLLELQEKVEREGWAARMLAGATVLSEAQGAEALVEQRLEQIIADFPETAAAQTARGHLRTVRRSG